MTIPDKDSITVDFEYHSGKLAARPIEKSDVNHVIRMYNSGVPKKEIARCLGISKNTVKEYIKKVEDQNLSPPELLEKETPELEGMFDSSVYEDEKYIQMEDLFPSF